MSEASLSKNEVSSYPLEQKVVQNISSRQIYPLFCLHHYTKAHHDLLEKLEILAKRRLPNVLVLIYDIQLRQLT